MSKIVSGLRRLIGLQDQPRQLRPCPQGAALKFFHYLCAWGIWQGHDKIHSGARRTAEWEKGKGKGNRGSRGALPAVILICLRNRFRLRANFKAAATFVVVVGK